VDLPGGSRLEHRIGPVTVVAWQGPIEDLLRRTQLDAVVSSDDSRLSMSGGVSLAIRDLAGPAMVEEARTGAPYPVGQLVTTSAGQLSVRYVLHAVTVDRDNDVIPTERTVSQLARQIFVRCEALGICDIAVPALATEAAKFSAQRAAALILKCLRAHVLNETVLRKVVFPLPSKEAYRAFVAELCPSDMSKLRRRSDTSEEQDSSVLGTREYTVASGSIQEGTLGRPAEDRTRMPAAARSPLPRVESASRGWWPFRRRSTLDAPTVPAPSQPDTVTDTEQGPVTREELDADGRPVLSRRYVLLEEIGRGGMGVVYLSWDLVLRRIVAIKSIRLTGNLSPKAGDLLRKEAAIGMDLTHHGIVRFYHFEPGSDSIGPYIVMEYLAWQSGEKWLADSGVAGLPVELVVSVGTQLCETLTYAHGREVLHGDIKPSNIFVDQAGEKAKLADFGLARVLAPGSHRAIQFSISGTPAYMAPEQRTPGGKVAPPTDIYQLAATLWDFLTGTPPTQQLTLPDRVDERRRVALEAVARALAVQPDDRPGSARVFGEMLQGALGA